MDGVVKTLSDEFYEQDERLLFAPRPYDKFLRRLGSKPLDQMSLADKINALLVIEQIQKMQPKREEVWP